MSVFPTLAIATSLLSSSLVVLHLISIAAELTAIPPTSSSPLDITQATVPATATSRQRVYLSNSYGFRFLYPENYTLDSSTGYAGATAPLLQRLEIWPPGNFDLQRYLASAADGAEWPAHISIEVLENTEGKPLTAWTGELITTDPVATTIAGQPALTYPSTGLYEADNALLATADGQYVLHFQVQYLDGASHDRAVFQAMLDSLVVELAAGDGQVNQIDYRRLESLLANQEWRLADLETRTILERLIGTYDYYYPYLSDRSNIFSAVPCSDLQTLDALWSETSNGQFGFTAQHSLWRSLRPPSLQPKIERFARQVGWWREAPYTDAEVGLSLADEHWKPDTDLTFGLDAPNGHLPWIGIASIVLETMLQNSGPACGSCTIDAMYMNSNRFEDYLRQFFERLQTCPANLPPPSF